MAWLIGAWKIVKEIPTMLTIAKAIFDAYVELKKRIEQNKKNDEADKAIAENDKKKMEELLGKKS